MSESTDPPEPAGEPADPPVPDSGGGESAETLARVKEPSQEELDALPADRRLELLELELQRRDTERDRRRQSAHQWINSGVLLIGVLLAGGSLIATAVTLRTGQEELRTAKEGQVTDRYTKAVEQLGSSKRDVRTAAIYALERIAADSARDRPTVWDVLAAFVREHDPAATVDDGKLPEEPDTDVQAALTVLARRPAGPGRVQELDLHAARTPGCQLRGGNLSGALLVGANLAEANLMKANMAKANLDSANLSGALLVDTNLNRAILRGTNLRGARLFGANLSGADLGDKDLAGAVWSDATRWPDTVGGVTGMRARSDKFFEEKSGMGFYRVRGK